MANTQVQKLIDHYASKGGNHYVIEEGVLGWGKVILYGPGLKTIITTEQYVSPWSCTHTTRMYNTCPKKYEKFLTL